MGENEKISQDSPLLPALMELIDINGNKRLSNQIYFIIEIEKMKTVLRQTLLSDGSRRENDAEHSWHLAIAALLLHEHAAAANINIEAALKMALVHDLVEVYAGDTFAYDKTANQQKKIRERAAADRLFAVLPDGQGAEFRALWEEFDAEETIEAKYAAAIDRFLPLVNNFLTNGHTWKNGGVDSADVYKRMDLIREGVPALWPIVENIIEKSIEMGILKQEGCRSSPQ